MNIKIEKAIYSDTKILNNLFSQLLEDDRINYDNNIKENLSMNNFFEKRINLEDSIIVVAKKEEEIIGYVYGYVRSDNKIKTELEAYIDSIYILKDFRNNKIGTKLINEFINVVKNKDVKYIFIENKHDNKIADHLYTKIGFKNFIETKRKEI